MTSSVGRVQMIGIAAILAIFFLTEFAMLDGFAIQRAIDQAQVAQGAQAASRR